MPVDVVEILIRAKNLTKEAFEAADKDVRRLSKSVGGLGGLLTTGAVVAFAAQVLEMGDDIQKTADRTGLMTDEVQQLSYIAGQSGNDIDELTSAVGQMQNRLAEGDKSAVAALKRLGLSFEDLRRMDPFQQLQQIAHAVGQIPNPANQAQVAMDLFGKAGIAILPTLKSNFDELAAAAPRMSEETVHALDAAGDAIDDLKLRTKTWAASAVELFSHVGDGVVLGVYPAIAKLYDGFASFYRLLLKAPGAEKLFPGIKHTIDELTTSAQWYRDAANAQGQQLDHLAQKAEATRKPFQALTVVQKEDSEAAKKAAREAQAHAEALEEIRRAAIPLTAEQKAAAIANDKLGISAATTAKALQVSAAAVQTYLDGVKTLAEITKKAGADIRALFEQIQKQQFDGMEKDAERTSAAWEKAEETKTAASQAAADTRAKMTLSEYDYQVYTIQREAEAKKQALDQHSSNYAEALAAIDNETAARMEDAKNIHNQKLSEMQAATNSWGNLTTKWLQSIPGLLQAAFTGGGGFGGAMKGLLSGIGGDIGDKLFSGPAGLGAKLASGLFGKGMGAEMATKFGNLLGTLGGPLGSMVANFGIGLGKKLFGALFGSAGRDVVKDFAQSQGGFDALHKELNELGADGEQLWIRLTQGVGRNNPEQARAAVDAVTAALEAHKHKVAEDAAATEAGAAQVSAAQQAAIDQAKSALKALDDEIASLQKSIDSEAPEEVMGVVEAQQRARLEALQKEREAARQHVEALTTSATDAANAVADAIKNIPKDIEVRVRTLFDGENGRPDLPSHDAGAYIRRDHLAHVHAGEMIGDQSFFGDVFAQMAAAMGGRGGTDTPIVINLDGQKVADILARRMPDSVRRFGVRR
ncbi:MAG TPA: hypothetical protein VNR64_07645 [Vicinamibacterales bacterium]|nr:hypothetical protein [Vicinamibacterales bacterium]